MLSNIIETLDKFKKPKDYCYMRKYHLVGIKFNESYIVDDYFVGRLKDTNLFHAYKITEDIRSHTFIEIRSMKEPSKAEGRQAFSNIDPTSSYLAMSDGSYLCIFQIRPMETSEIYF